mmetsp:Transcript_27672/g.37380  ORF Transcript_27672/g.37380 Transcript_27672/m.37380 type:complete len:114 (-) Transcript_27672:132-473(-)
MVTVPAIGRAPGLHCHVRQKTKAKGPGKGKRKGNVAEMDWAEAAAQPESDSDELEEDVWALPSQEDGWQLRLVWTPWLDCSGLKKHQRLVPSMLTSRYVVHECCTACVQIALV